MIAYPAVILMVADADDREFMKQLYVRYHAMMYRMAHSMLGSNSDIDDVVSEACVGLIRKVSVLRAFERNVLEAYIISTVKNAAYAYLRRQALRREDEQTMESIITVRNVTKRFGAQQVLKDVSLDIPKGKITGIIGRNGSGKTVLLKCIIGIMPCNEGEITVAGQRIGRDVDYARDVGFLIDLPGYIPGMSGYANLMYLASIQKRIGKAEVVRALERVELDPKSRKPAGKYSMGMKQRLGIAQALMEEPSILILDEPMNGLDNKGVGQMRNLLLELSRAGRTLVITSHNPLDIETLCDLVFEMDGGVLAARA